MLAAVKGGPFTACHVLHGSLCIAPEAGNPGSKPGAVWQLGDTGADQPHSESANVPWWSA